MSFSTYSAVFHPSPALTAQIITEWSNLIHNDLFTLNGIQEPANYNLVKSRGHW
jgi:hypothetical protein